MLLVEGGRAELEAFYLRYLQRCNEHRFSELDEFVDENVEVNGSAEGLRDTPRGWTRSPRPSRVADGVPEHQLDWEDYPN